MGNLCLLVCSLSVEQAAIQFISIGHLDRSLIARSPTTTAVVKHATNNMKATLFTLLSCPVLLAHNAQSFTTTGFRTTTALAPKNPRPAHAKQASPYSSPVLSRTAATSGHGLSMMSDDGPLSYFKKFKDGWGESIAARDPEELGPGPSKINEKSKPVQVKPAARKKVGRRVSCVGPQVSMHSPRRENVYALSCLTRLLLVLSI